MYIVLVLFFASFLMGQMGAIGMGRDVSVYAHDIMAGVVVLSAMWTAAKRRKLILPVLFLPITAFGLAALLSLIVNFFRFRPEEIVHASLYLVRWVAYAWVYVALVQGMVTPGFLLWGLFVTGSAFSVLGFAQYVLYPDLRNLAYLGWDPHLSRLFSTFLDPNFAGIIIVLTVFLGVYLWQKRPSRWLVAANAANILALYLTYSRSSYLALIVGGIAWICMERRWRWLILIAVFIILVVAIPRPGGKTLRLTRMDSTISRMQNWQQTLPIIVRAPVLGNGFNTLRFIQETRGEQTTALSRARSGVDSSILFLAATTGITGVIIMGWLIYVMKRLFTGVKSRALYCVFVSFAVALSVHSLFVNSLFYPWVMLWMWVFLAASETMMRGVGKASQR